MLNLKPTEQTAGMRLDVFVASQAEISRSQAQQWIENGLVSVNGVSAVKKYVVTLTDEVAVEEPELKSLELEPQNIPLDIVYEDDHLLVVNKPKGMVVHPAAGHEDATLVNALLYHCGDSLSGINGVMRRSPPRGQRGLHRCAVACCRAGRRLALSARRFRALLYRPYP
ncbi:MAG: RluA family pseudouridine synthase [Clostridia bacterium]|nr:RluA family pseudouridine synthase [Clostridia bacterium]